jgi:lipoate-protein ligase A
LLDAGAVSPLRSQGLYHGLAESMGESTPDTIVLCRPAAPYFSVGFHQEPAEELDLAWCRRHGYPVLHRKIGGGTVYLDRRQLFYQCVFHRSRAPFDVASIYRRFLGPPVEALRRLGLDARLGGVNEIEVGGRRIAGTGGGQIGEAVVVVGNLLFDFDYDALTRAWRVPSEAFRRLAGEGLRRYVTTLRRELPGVPPVDEVCDLLVEAYSQTLGRSPVPGSVTMTEEEAIGRAEAELSTGERAALEEMPRPDRGLKIARDTYVRECVRDGPQGRLRLTVRIRGDTIDAIAAQPGRWASLARDLAGCRLDAEALGARVGGAEGGSDLVDALVALGHCPAR